MQTSLLRCLSSAPGPCCAFASSLSRSLRLTHAHPAAGSNPRRLNPSPRAPPTSRPNFRRTLSTAMSTHGSPGPLSQLPQDPSAAPPAPPSSGSSAPMAEVPPGMEAEAALLEAFTAVPNITKLQVQQEEGGRQLLTVYCSQRNLPSNSQRKYTVSLSMDRSSGQALASQPQELAPDLLLAAPSPAGSSQVVFKSPAAADSSCSLVLQQWQGARLACELLVPKALHGPLVNDGYWATGVAWSPDGGAVAYTAEVPPSERTPSWGGPESLKDQAGPKSWRGVGPALEDWGELNSGKRAPGVYVLDVTTRQVVKVPIRLASSPPDAPPLESVTSFGQPVWCRDGSGLVLVGWPHQAPNFPSLPQRLGVVYCYNRGTALYFVPCSRTPEGGLSWGPAVELSRPHTSSAISPLFSPDGSQLVFISQEVAVQTGTHSATGKLCVLPWPQAKAGGLAPKVVVDVVSRPGPGAASFPGLYVSSLMEEGFVSDDTLLLNTQWRSQSAIVAVNIGSGQVRALSPVGGEEQACFSLLGVAQGRLFACKAAPNQPHQLVTADLPASHQLPTSLPLAWSPVLALALGMPRAVSDALQRLHFSVTQVTPTVGDVTQVFECIHVHPRDRGAGPLPGVVFPHGGPHTAQPVGWMLSVAFLASLGYAVILPNYRGSVGFGQESLASLPGHIGTNDVEDCRAALQAAVSSGLVDPGRVAVVGGSHGGFLTGHLLGQYPGEYKAGVLRNPVCNLSLMVGISDIPDWIWVEAFGSGPGMSRAAAVPTPADLDRMFAASPIAHAHKVLAPMLLLLGAKDRRVDMKDGLQYAAALRAGGASAAARAPGVVVFPEDTHALDRPQTEFEQWVNVAAWLRRHVVA